jgi:hypothetical protein
VATTTITAMNASHAAPPSTSHSKTVGTSTIYGLLRHRLPGRSDFTRVTLLAAIGFGIVALLPAVKIPANPPAVGGPATVGTRTGIYGAVLLAGIVTAMLVVALVNLLRSREASTAGTTTAAVALTAVLLTLILVLVPDNPDTIAADVPAAVVWNFRLASLGQLAVLWTALGLAGGPARAAASPPCRCRVRE